MMSHYSRTLLIAAAVGGGAAPLTETHAQHPLDPLSVEEIRTATQVMRADPRLADASFTLITGAEPAREQDPVKGGR